jgi:aldehyde dehydrogenase (NAD+)
MNVDLPFDLGFLDGGAKRLLIGDTWVESGSGQVLPSHNPATGEVIAAIADGTPEDVDRGVASERRAFEGEWSRWAPYDRLRALLRLADLVESNYDELSLLDTLEMGAPWSRTRLFRREVPLSRATTTIERDSLAVSLSESCASLRGGMFS